MEIFSVMSWRENHDSETTYLFILIFKPTEGKCVQV